MTYRDPAWLIGTVRMCLMESGVEWREIFDMDGCRFRCGREVKVGGCANFSYLTICVVKQSLDNRYYIELDDKDAGGARVFEESNDWLEHSKQELWTVIRDFVENRAAGEV